MGNCCSLYTDDEPINLEAVAKAKEGSPTSLYDLTNNITVSMKMQEAPIVLSRTLSQTIPMQLKIDVAELGSCEKAPLDIVVVLDHSGSMAGERMNLAKEACYHLLQYLGPQDRMALVRFDHRAVRLTRLLTMTKEHKSIITQDIRSMEADGGTNITAGIELAIKILHRRRYVNTVSTIFLLSDREDEEAEEGVRNLISDYSFNDIFTSTRSGSVITMTPY